MVGLDRVAVAPTIRRQPQPYAVANHLRAGRRVSEQLGNAADAIDHEPSSGWSKMGLHPLQPSALGQAMEDRGAIREEPGSPRRADSAIRRTQAAPQRWRV